MGEIKLPKEGIDIPGPMDWENTSHGLRYDEVNFTVETWGSFGPERKYKLRTRVRPMCESEIIGVKTKGHSREAVLNAYGVVETPYVPPVRRVRVPILLRLRRLFRRQ